MRRAVLVAGLLACQSQPQSPPQPVPGPLVLPVAAEQPPEAPGRDAFMGGCLVCHSYRYVETQPPFPVKVWTAEVDKMIKVYGAPIAPEAAPRIVEYLVATHGAR